MFAVGLKRPAHELTCGRRGQRDWRELSLELTGEMERDESWAGHAFVVD
jgi:hypothetical protein